MHFSKQFKRAWAKNNQRLHDMILARPTTRYLRRWPDPALERTLPCPVPVAALRHKPSARTIELSKPNLQPPTSPPKTPFQVDPAVLNYTPTKRILELARPAHKGKRPKGQEASSQHKVKPSKSKKRLYNKERVLVLASRKITPKPPPIEKKPPKPLAELMPRIKVLCEPPPRYQMLDLPAVTGISKLKMEKTQYECPERIKQLAQPRDFAEFKLDEEYDPYVINPAALTYVATENIKKIAEPKRKEEKRIKKG